LRFPEIGRRAGRFIWWRTYLTYKKCIQPAADPLAARWGWAARFVRYPLPWAVPFRQSELHVRRGSGLGDVLMCTPALRELKQRNPSCHVTFYTDYQDLVAGLPFIDVVRPTADTPGPPIDLDYKYSLIPHRHLARIIGDHLGLEVQDVQPSCMVDVAQRDRFREKWQDFPRPWVTAIRRSSTWTPNKDWPDASWEELIGRVASWGTLIEVGSPSPVSRQYNPGRSYIDMTGKTNIPELVAAIAASDLHVGPVTGTVHIAAAVGVRSVVIYGGYEHPVCSGYAGNINIYSAVPCAPCWLRDDCPYGKKCLHMITPDQVEAALKRLWENRRQALPPV
jgi:ADP-heptose:LPS heptosyltransferase